MRPSAVVVGVLVCIHAALSAQVPARDVVTTRVGTATITGLVMSDTNQPLRHAVVTVATTGARVIAPVADSGFIAVQDPGSPQAVTGERAAVTDELGRFAIPSLAPGSYMLTAAKPGYVTMRNGQKRPSRGTGVSVAVGAGQTIDAGVIRLPKGAVITGTINDETGRARRGIQLTILEYRLVNGERQLMSVGAALAPTDDRGVYRAYGLPAGEYVVSAAPPTYEGIDGSELRRTTAAEVDWAERQVRGASQAAPVPVAAMP